MPRRVSSLAECSISLSIESIMLREVCFCFDWKHTDIHLIYLMQIVSARLFIFVSLKMCAAIVTQRQVNLVAHYHNILVPLSLDPCPLCFVFMILKAKHLVSFCLSLSFTISFTISFYFSSCHCLPCQFGFAFK